MNMDAIPFNETELYNLTHQEGWQVDIVKLCNVQNNVLVKSAHAFAIFAIAICVITAIEYIIELLSRENKARRENKPELIRPFWQGLHQKIGLYMLVIRLLLSLILVEMTWTLLSA